MIKAILFDFDGTLFDSMSVWDHLAERFLASRGKSAKPGLQESLRTLSHDQASRLLKDQYDLDESPEEITSAVRDLLAKAYRQDIQPKKGIPELIKNLKKAGYRLGIATAGDKDLVQAALERCVLCAAFDWILTCQEVGAGKLSPAIYRQAALRWGLEKTQVLVVEDAPHALATAQKDGFATIAVSDASQSQQERENLQGQADLFLNSFEETRDFWAYLDKEKRVK